MIEVVCTAITGICTIVCAIVGVLISKANKQSDARLQQQILQMEMQDANTQLTIAVANAVLGKKNNGNVEKAYTAAKESNDKYHEFLSKYAVNKLNT